MALIKLGQDPESPEGKSPTLYLDDEKGTYLVQGWKVVDAARRAQLDLPDHEDVIEIPQRMVRFFPEVKSGGGADS
ncbi:hypothetical protein [Streptomyces sp. SID13726]|uniref:hypothetical protein n=1 Tax=Streptomyces sp. SID13726 TaxID=2706058 RepID=UPI0013BB284F|nr:hypothetical protein [Streptomyces sp. SID13726]NEB03321.1 hypothetical protein [Streptomyces sp. SID13726]